jgi:transposase
VAASARRLRRAQGLPPGHRRPRQPLPAVAEAPCPLWTPHRATWLVLRRETQRTEAETQQRAQWRAQSAEVAEAMDLAQDFVQLVRQRQPACRDPWLQRATTRALEALQRFARGIREDYEAVKAGVTLPWSTSPVEGHINRLKMLKRQMFGRARLALLGCRFVRTPGERQAQAAGPGVAAQIDAVAA